MVKDPFFRNQPQNERWRKRVKARSYQFLNLSVSFNDTNRDMILFFSKKERCCSIDYFMICRHFKPLGSFFCIFSRLFREQRKPNSTSLTIHKRQQSRSQCSRAAFFKASLYLLYLHSSTGQKRPGLDHF